MNTSKASSVVWSFLATALITTMFTAAQAADQFVQVTNPGWTNTGQYSCTGAWGDYDNDGFIDLFVPNSVGDWGAWTNFLYLNNGDGSFTRQSARQVGSIASDKKTSWGGYWGDVNNDGFLDLLAVGDAVQLYLNNGDGSFRSADAGDLSKVFGSNDGWLACADYDNDGNLDVFACTAPNNRLFHGRGDGTFNWVTNSVISLDRVSYSNDAAWGDFDNDGLMDLIVANWNAHDFSYHNDGRGQFSRMTNSILEKYVGSHHAWGDFDNDGYLDLAAGDPSGNTRLFRNSGMGDFVTATNLPAATAVMPVWGDYDNDGYLDLLLSNGQDAPAQLQLYHNNGDGTFSEAEDAFTRTSANWFGGGWGDYDNDGFMDLFMTQTSGQNTLYHNLGNSNPWIKFLLNGTKSNRSAIGAKVRVKATIGGKTVWQMREVSGGNFCQNDLRPNFGLGDATNVDIVRIEWPSGVVQELRNVAPKQFLTVWEPLDLRGAVLADGSCQLTITAEPNHAWRIESSTDLKTWQTLATITSPTPQFQYTHTGAKGLSCLFYRVVSP